MPICKKYGADLRRLKQTTRSEGRWSLNYVACPNCKKRGEARSKQGRGRQAAKVLTYRLKKEEKPKVPHWLDDYV